MGGSRCVRNTPTRCGNNLPILLQNLTFSRKCTLWYRICMLTFCVETLAFFHVWNKVLQAKWLYWPWDHFMVFMKKSLWHGIYQSDLRFSCEAYFLDSLYNWCISFCAIYICMPVFYMYIYIYYTCMFLDMDFHVCQLGEVFLVAAGAFLRGKNDVPGILWRVLALLRSCGLPQALFSGKNDAPGNLWHGYSLI